jgi:hypothetical protein
METSQSIDNERVHPQSGATFAQVAATTGQKRTRSAHPAVRRANFTGWAAVGRITGETADRHSKRCVFELKRLTIEPSGHGYPF